MLSLSFNNTIFRFYLMMLIAVFAVWLHQPWLIFVVYAVGVSAILGYRISMPRRKKGRKIKMESLPRQQRKVA